MSVPPSPSHRLRLFHDLLLIVTVLTFAGLLQFVWISRQWPLAHDAPLLRYVVFLTRHGYAPYRDIIEINMPGTYMLEGLGITVFGPYSAGTWRLDMFFGLLVLLASVWIAGPRARTAGLFAASFVMMEHLWDGPGCLDQRDWYIAIFLLLSAGFFFHAMRHRQPAWIAGAGFCSAASATMKPPYMLVGVALLATLLMQQRRPAPDRARRLTAVALWFLAGTSLPLLAVAVYLMRWHAVGAFLGAVRGLIGDYASIRFYPPASMAYYYALHWPSLLAPVPLYLLNRSWRRSQSNMLAIAACLAALIFIAQGKGWVYQLYPLIALSAIWAGIEVQHAFHQAGWWQRIAAAAILLWLFFLVRPLPVRKEPLPSYSMDHIYLLQNDLARLGGPALNKKVQCLDMTLAGCINVLYRMSIVQSTGFIYDYQLFPAQSNPTVLGLRNRFMQQIAADPPKVIVLSADVWPNEHYGYDELANFPALQQFLAERYTLDPATPESYLPIPNVWAYHPTTERLYRLYILR